MTHPQTPDEYATQLSGALGHEVTTAEIGPGWYRDRINRLVRSIAHLRNQRISHAWVSLYDHAGVPMETRAIDMQTRQGMIGLWRAAERWAR